MKLIKGYQVICCDCGTNCELYYCHVGQDEQIELCNECIEKRENEK